MLNRFLACAFLLMLTGCMSLGPDYQRPDIDMPEAWRFEEKESKDLANTAWWGQFNDPVLNGLVTTALEENKDIRIATARVEEFFGRYFSTRGDQYPIAGGSASGYRTNASDEGITPTAGMDNPYNQYDALLNAGWEIDFWGKFRRATEAGRAELLGTEEARRAVVLTLVSAVASSYVEIRTLDKQLEITRQTAVSRKDTRELFTMRFKNGVISEVELSQAESEYQDALARIPEIELSIARLENSLSVLLGHNPGAIPRGLTVDELKRPEVPSGLPSDLLVRRPDIRLAEQSLIAANARIGVAKSLYFPTISLTGTFGAVSTDLSDLFSGPSETWNYGVPINVPIFTFGRIGGEVKAAKAVQQQLVYGYQLTIQNAFREVEDSLIDHDKSGQRLDALDRQLNALRNYARLARLRYDGGYTSYLEVLDAERSLFNIELSYAAGQNTLFRSLINIYKSMGGGWVEAAEDGITLQPVKEAGFLP